MRLYELEKYSQKTDLDGYPFEPYLEKGMIVSLTLVQKKMDSIKEIDDIKIVDNSLKLLYKEEVFFKIIDIGKKYTLEFYDFYGDNNIYQLPESLYANFKGYQTYDEYRNQLHTQYFNAIENEKTKPNIRSNGIAKMLKNNTSLDESLNEIINTHSMHYWDITNLCKYNKCITEDQCKQALKTFKNCFRATKPDHEPFTPHKVVDYGRCYEHGGQLKQSRWLKLGDQITCNLSNIHYVPIQLNKINIDKPYIYKFLSMRKELMTDSDGRVIANCQEVLDRLKPSCVVRCQFTIHDKYTERSLNICKFLKIIKIEKDLIYGELLARSNGPLSDYDSIQQISNIMTFKKSNISEISLGHFNDTYIKYTKYSRSMTGYRPQHEDTQYDYFE